MWPNTLDGVVWDIQMSNKVDWWWWFYMWLVCMKFVFALFLLLENGKNLVNYAFKSLENGEIGVLRCF